MSKLLAAAAIATLFSAPPAHSESIEWHVPDRFRLWDRAYAGDEVIGLDQLLERVRMATGPSAIEKLMLKFLATQQNLHEKAYWRTDQEIYDREYIWPMSYRVRLRAPGLSGVCAWTSSVGAFDAVSKPCEAPVELVLPAADNGLGSVAARISVTDGSGSPAETDVQVRDRLIASVGDSFAAGEGNPDAPMDLSRLPREFASADAQDKARAATERWTAYRFVPWKNIEWTNRWLGRGAVVAHAGGARWWDTRCHRSFYSQHMVAALRYAAAHPREATTFVSYACSGAETFAGLLARQSQPPGYSDGPRLARLNYAQLEVLIANLCPPAGKDSAEHERARQYFTDGKWITDYSWRCTGGRGPRPIDALLITDGGNDIGFGPVIQDALLPPLEGQSRLGRGVLKELRERGTRTPDRANGKIKEVLPKNYELLRQRVAQIVPAGIPIIQSAYPNPLFGSDGNLCAGDLASVSLAAMEGFWPDKSVDPNYRWKMSIIEAEAKAAELKVVQPLNAAVRSHVEAGAASGWRLVDDFQPKFRNRGWCAFGPGDTPLALPNWDPAARRWSTWSPASWRPYASKARLFRTPNDAAMTQQPADPRRVLGAASKWFEGSLSQQQESLLSAMSGSFHPTFEAHAIMGWSVGEVLISTLDNPAPAGWRSP